MNPVVQVFAILLGVGIIVISIKSLKKHTLSELQAGMWLFVGVLSIILGIFPGIIMWVAEILGITWPPAILLLLAIVCLGLIVFGRTREINDLSSKQIELAEKLSIALYDVERLANRVKALEEQSSDKTIDNNSNKAA